MNHYVLFKGNDIISSQPNAITHYEGKLFSHLLDLMSIILKEKEDILELLMNNFSVINNSTDYISMVNYLWNC